MSTINTLPELTDKIGNRQIVVVKQIPQVKPTRSSRLLQASTAIASKFKPWQVVLGSMLLSFAAYCLIMPAPLAACFITMLAAHEYGHIWAARRIHIGTSVPVFIPFLGALISFNDMPKNAKQEAFVGIGGPLAGALAVCVPVLLYLSSGQELWAAAVVLGCAFNLFNLLPVVPLDGGRIAAAVSPKLWAIGFVALTSAAVYFHTLVLILISLAMLAELTFLYRERKAPQYAAYYNTSMLPRLKYGACYLALAVVLALAIYAFLPGLVAYS